MSFDYSQAKDVLLQYNSSRQSAVNSTLSNRATLVSLQNELNTAIQNGESDVVIKQKSDAVQAQQDLISTSRLYLRMLNTAKTNARNVVYTTIGITPTTSATTNPFVGATGPSGPIGPVGPTGPQPSTFTSGVQVSAISEYLPAASVSGNTVTVDFSQSSCFFTSATFTSLMTIQIQNLPYTTQNAVHTLVLVYQPTSSKYYTSTLKYSTGTSGYTTATMYYNGTSSSVTTTLTTANTYAIQQFSICNSGGTVIALTSVSGFGS